ncbi:hypothetical protein DPEC_G00227540 [Dallia pectoralis]|uniref:Uncharacterized protein n=1 Tax=Dallia pectoralis TaxID=75939 RepID=A0ACC2G187_DALPE|nr:hypothetical protein DPEC_G00227540 [Dallia pectoralis]
MLSPLRAFISACLLTLCDGVMETVVGVAGKTVSLPCRYDAVKPDLTDVCWGLGRGSSAFSCENAVVVTKGDEVTYRRSRRYRLGRNLRHGDFSLNIYSAHLEDSGFYHCRVELPGLFNDLVYIVHLIVQPAPSVFFQAAPALAIPVTPGPPVTPHRGKQETPKATMESRIGRQGEPDPEIFPNTTPGRVMLLVKRTQRVLPSPTLASYVGHTIRVGAIVFIPGLILTVLLSYLRRYRNFKARGGPASSSSPDSNSLLSL